MRKQAWVAAVLTGLSVLAGCLPIELDVAPDGSVAVPRGEGFYALSADGSGKLLFKGEGSPVFAAYAPHGKQLLAVTQDQGGGMMGAAFKLTLVDLAQGKSRLLASMQNVTYAAWSPDGKWIAVSRLSEEQRGGIEQNLPELHLIDVASGMSKPLAPAAPVNMLHRWLPDSSALIAFVIKSQNQENNTYVGELSKIAVADGAIQPLAAVVGEQGVFFDVSPDGRKVMFTAKGAGAVGQEVAAMEEVTLSELDIASGAIRAVRPEARFAIYSPKGGRLLLGFAHEQGVLKLEVADATGANAVEVALDAAGEAGGMGESATIYPAWRDEDTVLYLASRAVYGAAGKNLHLMTVSHDGKTRANHQASLDAAANRQ